MKISASRVVVTEYRAIKTTEKSFVSSLYNFEKERKLVSERMI